MYVTNKVKLKEFVGKIENFDDLPDGDKILVFAYYLQNIEKLSTFNEKMMNQCFDILDLPVSFSMLKTLIIMGSQKLLIKKGISFSSLYKYRLSSNPAKKVEKLLESKPLATFSKNLKDLTPMLGKDESKFMREALDCLRVKAWRAALILVWIMVIDHLQDYIINQKLSEFNQNLFKYKKYQNIKVIKKDDFEDIKEYDLVSIMESAGLISKQQKTILHEKLATRNSYAHPSTLVLTESKVTSFIEDLVHNIILQIN